MRRRESPTPLCALIVEPNAAASRHAADILKALGYESIWQACSIHQALRYCTVTPFDLALVELVLEDQDGTDLAIALRAWPGSVDYVIAVSVDSDRLQHALDNKIPADALLLKPIHRPALLRCIGHRFRQPKRSVFDDASDLMIVD